jgi:hypothetical protein
MVTSRSNLSAGLPRLTPEVGCDDLSAPGRKEGTSAIGEPHPEGTGPDRCRGTELGRVNPGNQNPGKTATSPKRGKAVNIYLHDADQLRIRELAAYLANEGLRVSDSQVIKAALLLAQPDKRLLKAYLEITGADQRYKQEPDE